MRTENIKITMEMPVKFNEPDLNGCIYTKECWEEAIKNVNLTPIEILNNGVSTVVGVVQDAKLIEKDSEAEIIVTGVLRYGGTCEDVQLTKDVVTSMMITGFGITK